jgi:UDP-glucose 6-dehydrogenase
MCVDNDWQKVALLQRGKVPIYEEFLPERPAKHRRGRLRFTVELGGASLCSKA